MIRRCLLVVLALAASSVSVSAQSLDETLGMIERNNLSLQALKQSAEAEKMEVQTLNNLDDPTVEYSSFYTRGTGGQASSELEVIQEFDFPTLYAARHKEGEYRQEAIEKEYAAARRDILLSAELICLDLIRLNQEYALLSQRLDCADRLLSLFERRLEEGDVGILEVNKIKMKRMDLSALMTTNEAAHREALQSLLAMNGNQPLEFTADTYPSVETVADMNALMDEVLASDPTLKAAEADALAARKGVSVSRQGWLPKIEIGYRRNTDLSEKLNGFLVGGSLPVFSNRKKTKIARAQAASAQLLLDDARLKLQAEVQAHFNELRELEATLAVYDLPLMEQTVALLYEAVAAGQISIIDYYAEADDVYGNMLSRIETECEYRKLLAEVYKNRL